MTLTKGSIVETSGNYVKILTVAETAGEFKAVIQGPFTLETISVSFLVETLTGAGVTTSERYFAFRQSQLYGDGHIPWFTLQITRNF